MLSRCPWSWTSSWNKVSTRVTGFWSCYSINVFLSSSFFVVWLTQWRFTRNSVIHNRMLLASASWCVTTEWTLSILTGPIFNSSNDMWANFHTVQIVLLSLRKTKIWWLLYIVDRRIFCINTSPPWTVLTRSRAIGLATKLVNSSLRIKLNSNISLHTFEWPVTLFLLHSSYFFGHLLLINLFSLGLLLSYQSFIQWKTIHMCLISNHFHFLSNFILHLII